MVEVDKAGNKAAEKVGGDLIDKSRRKFDGQVIATDVQGLDTSTPAMEVDQESLHASKAEATQVETDLTDETQDFRLLERLNLYAATERCFHCVTLTRTQIDRHIVHELAQARRKGLRAESNDLPS